jgi:hypothetical protein
MTLGSTRTTPTVITRLTQATASVLLARCAALGTTDVLFGPVPARTRPSGDVHSDVIGLVHQDKVLDAIVGLVAVDVMHDLGTPQRSAEVLFHNDAMFVPGCAGWCSHEYIPTLNDGAATAPGRATLFYTTLGRTRTRAVPPATGLRHTGLDLVRLVTDFTCHGDTILAHRESTFRCHAGAVHAVPGVHFSACTRQKYNRSGAA